MDLTKKIKNIIDMCKENKPSGIEKEVNDILSVKMRKALETRTQEVQSQLIDNDSTDSE